jgi:hypothetical protein
MAAPALSARSTPSGILLPDGYQTLISFTANTSVSFWEKTVKPPGVDGGDPIQETTMHNTAWRTMAPRALKTLTESTCVCAYDPNLYNQIVSLINVRTSITVHFPDGSTLVFYGFLQKFEPSEMKEGDQPEATVTICPTNYDPSAHAEASPVLTSVAGT